MSASGKTENLQGMGNGKEGRDAAGGNQVVSTCMTDAREGVVFGVEVDVAAA